MLYFHECSVAHLGLLSQFDIFPLKNILVLDLDPKYLTNKFCALQHGSLWSLAPDPPSNINRHLVHFMITMEDVLCYLDTNILGR